MGKTEIILPCLLGFTLRTSGGNLIADGKNEQEVFPISKIQSFTLKEPKRLTRGTITFYTGQAPTAGLRIGIGALALGAEKTYVFETDQLPHALALRDYILSYEENDTKPEAKVVSVVDEIRGLKELLDEGILTQEEFEAKKRQLLGI